ncbi:ariadne RING finger [Byssothecium circinans]|uniref:RBR-type E3 ubiquitin transferase n=1 Tax=Byssothecium circinans TaxID=147558 RepID=A0A6A5U1T1_9PLEO|nr:ariadne RING finger [Byssothecium circinans]
MSSSLATSSFVEFLSDDDDGTVTEAGPSVGFAERQANAFGKLSQMFQCAACCSRFPVARMVTAKCSHRYCVDCMISLFMRSTKDESLFPPKCCRQPIALSMISPYMSADDLATFEAKTEELTTTYRVYCSNHSCNAFIPPRQITNGTHRAVCSDCAHSTCSICKNTFHKDSDCPEDPGIQQTLELAHEQGWQTCPRCKSLVELRTGCYHMTCRCKAQFCYLCARKWKTCSCNTADEHRLEERAEEIVDRNAEDNLGLVERQHRVRRVHEELRENHECEHPGRFQRVFHPGRRGFTCEMCDDRHWKYILQCRHCYINVCEECRRNRV